MTVKPLIRRTSTRRRPKRWRQNKGGKPLRKRPDTVQINRTISDGDDILNGDAGNDQAFGGAGADTILVGQGDLASGGDAGDTFILADYNEIDANAVMIVGGSGYDNLDVGARLQPGSVVKTGDNVNGNDGTLTLQDGTLVTFSGIEGVVRFTRGTRIATLRGERPIDTLSRGDLVKTAQGPMPIRWIGNHSIEKMQLQANPNLAPIRIPANALGPGRPLRDLVVSPQHRILIANRVAERMFDAQAILVPAKDLVGFFGVTRQQDAPRADYWHVLLDRHHVLQAEGIWAKSLFPGEEAMKGLPCASRDEIFAIFFRS